MDELFTFRRLTIEDSRANAMRKLVFFIFLLYTCFAANVCAQETFDPKEGCLNVVNFAAGPGIGEYGDRHLSVTYAHEFLLNEQFSIGGGIGFSRHDRYKMSAIPLFLSTTYFFLDKRFSPYINMHVGVYFPVSKKDCDTYEKYSLSSKQGASFYMSPSVGVKAHITPNIGMMVSVGTESFVMNVFDTKKENYSSKLVSNLSFNLGIFFQIPGW